MRAPKGSARWHLLLLAMGCVIVTVDATKIDPAPTSGELRVLRVEPEENETFSPQTHVRVAERVSGLGFISIVGWPVSHPQYGRAVAGETAYRTDIPADGTYHLWVRARWAGVCANSITLAVTPLRGDSSPSPPPDHQRHLVGNDLIYDRWHWVRGPVVTLQQGPHEIFLGTRESGAAIDCIVISPDRAFVPSDAVMDASAARAAKHSLKPRPFSDNFANTPEPVTPLGHDWLPDDSEWLQLRDSGLSVAGPVLGGTALAQARTGPLASGYVECSLKPSARVGGGLFFGRVRPGDYYFVRLAGEHADKPYASRVQVGHQKGDTTRILSEGESPLSEWVQLSVWFSEQYCRTAIDGTPVLQTPLPRSAMGNVGLYVDGDDPVLRSSESVVDLTLSDGESLGLADYLPLPTTQVSDWPGLTAVFPGGEFFVLRWTNISRDESFAKRVELVRYVSGEAAECIGERWGGYSLDRRPSLRLDWSDDELRASIDQVEFAGYPVSAGDVLGGLAVSSVPRCFFGDFLLQPLQMEGIEPQAAEAGGVNAEPGGRHSLGLKPFLTGVLTSQITPGMLPCGWVFQMGEEGAPNTLRLARAGTGRLRLSWTAGDGGQRIVDLPEELSSSKPAIQLVFDLAEILVLVDGRLVLADALPVQRVERIEGLCAASASRPPRTIFTPLPEPPEFSGAGAPRPASDVRGMRLHGDAMIMLRGTASDHLALRLHAVGIQRGSGYELEILKRDGYDWRLYRNGEPVRSGTLSARPDNEIDLRLTQRGSVLRCREGPDVMFVYRDPQALRAGLLAVHARNPADSKQLSVDIVRPWDVWCVFHQDLKAMSSFALWKRISGRWTLDENEKRTNGYMLGAAAGEDAAIIEYKGDLDADELLFEMQIDTRYLRPGHELSILLGDGSDAPGDVVVLRSPADGVLEGELHRDEASSDGRIGITGLSPVPVITVMRTAEDLTLDFEYVPFLHLDRRAIVPVHRLALRLRGPPEQEVAILSIGIQEDPLAAPRIPAPRRILLDFLRLAIGAPFI